MNPRPRRLARQPVDSDRVVDGDYMYMAGDIIRPVLLPGSIRNQDFSAARYAIPLFSDGFDAGS